MCDCKWEPIETAPRDCDMKNFDGINHDHSKCGEVNECSIDLFTNRELLPNRELIALLKWIKSTINAPVRTSSYQFGLQEIDRKITELLVRYEKI